MKIRFANYDWIVVNTSAGKDSQAMLDYVCKHAEAHGVLDRIVAVHCDLGEEEWEGTKELAEEQAKHYGIRFEVVKRKQGGILQHVMDRHRSLTEKAIKAAPWPRPDARFCTSDHKRGQIATLFTKLTAETRASAPPWPSNTARWCTSDHKRGPVNVLLTKLATEKRQQMGKGYRVRILDCLGMRAGESCGRSKLRPFYLDKRNTNSRRIVHIWLPIHSWSVDDVWASIRQAGTKHHYAYDLGMPRLSCCFCIFAPRSALMLAGRHNPDLLDRYCDVEEKTGFAFRKELPLVEIRAALARGEEPGPIQTWEM